MSNIKRFIIIEALFLLALAGSAYAFARPGAANAAPLGASIPEIMIHGHEFAFSGPDQIEAGLVAITLMNDGHEPHQANIARLKDGKTMDDLATALKQSPGAALALLGFVGGPNTVAPGASQRVVIGLDAGDYVLLCFVPSPDGVPHLAKGMIKPLKVVARAGQDAQAEPKADAEATLKDFMVMLPSAIKAGAQSWKVTNTGPESHELGLIKLAQGKTLDDFNAFIRQPAGPPPFADVGGIGALAPGKSGWFDIDLQPGNYIALCFISSAAHGGKAHVELGMSTAFTIAGDSAGAPATLPKTGLPDTTAGMIWLVIACGILLLIAGGAVWLRSRRAS
jgi:LPXTG-motif cell wall-anchored protein